MRFLASALLLTSLFWELGLSQQSVNVVDDALCLPQLSLRTPISAVTTGDGLCPPRGQENNFTEFLQNVIQDQPIGEGCTLQEVQLSSCQTRGRNRPRTFVQFTANLICGSSCRRHLDIRSSFDTDHETAGLFVSARRSRPTLTTTYEGNEVTITWFRGRSGRVARVCPLGAVDHIRNKLELCACPQGCPEVCELPAVTGRCRAAFPRYFFNSESGQCEQFIYGGCDGNDNNFETEEACQDFCGEPGSLVDICELPPETGPCEALFRRYFFNSESGQCEQFVYGGCDGNDNNFERFSDCLETCAECSNGKEFQSCGTACPRTCENVDDVLIPCTLQCVIGCFCPEGLVELGDQCVPPEECPPTEY